MTAFVFRDRASFLWPVTVSVPERGSMVETSFEAEFVALPEDDLFIGAEGGADAAPTIIDLIQRDRERLREVLVGWSGIEDESGAPIAFSPDARDRLLEHRAIRIALGEAYGAAMLGMGEERRGN